MSDHKTEKDTVQQTMAQSPISGRPQAKKMSLTSRWILGLFPVALLAGISALFLTNDPTAQFRAAFPPVEELTIERVSFPEAGSMRVHVVNGGPEPVTIAQVIVDDAYWQFKIDRDPTVPRLNRATLELNYPWVEGELLWKALQLRGLRGR